jgi:hypothetical protein
MREAAQEVRRTMTDPIKVCRALQLEEGSKRQSAGISVRCPVHDDSDPSCSVTRGPDGTLRAKCFSCGWAGDVLALVAAVYSLDVRRAFREVLLVAAELGGLHDLATELRGNGARAPERPLPPEPEKEPSRDYPPQAEIESTWRDAVSVDRIGPCQEALAKRALYPGAELARALTGSQSPWWARYRGQTWHVTGHLILLPAYTPDLAMRSLRAWQIAKDYDGPKRLPPAGYRATELCLANSAALAALEAGGPCSLVIVEGEPDTLAATQRWPGHPVLGVISGSWTQAWADRVPLCSEVTIHTHHDEAGDRYAAAIKATLARRAIVRRAA